MARFKVKFCPHGHEIAIVGRDKTGHCRRCILDNDHSEYNRVYYERNHEYELARRKKYVEEHKDQVKLELAEYYKNHAEEIHRKRKEKYDPKAARRYYEENKDLCHLRSNRWRRNNQHIVKALKIKNETERNFRVVAWTDWDKIKKFYKHCPKDMTVDHIIPLRGKLVSGLHVSWNLQYLIPTENYSKRHNVDLNDASRLYGKILENTELI